MSQNFKIDVINSFLWKLLERTGTQGIQFIVQIILARILTPNDYGEIALVSIFITLANVFVQSGFNVALIQKKNVDNKDYAAVFCVSLVVAGALYSVLFFTAPIIANFYQIKELIKILRILSLTLFLGAFTSVQTAIISKNMEFKKLFFSSLISIIFSGTIGILLAYNNFGIWSLIYQQLLNQLLVVLILLYIVKWKPTLKCSFLRVKALFGFSSKILISSLLDTIYMNITSLVIGRLYKPEILGYYNRGNQFPQIIVSNFNGTIQSVLFPLLSAEQDNKKKLKEMVRRAIITSSFIIFPLMTGMIVIAEPLVIITLTQKWILSVPYLRVFCLSYALWPIHTANLQAINAIGRSDIFLKLEIIKKIIGIIILIITIEYGAYAIAVGGLLSGIFSSFINATPNKKLLNYSYKEQLKDIMPPLILSIVMGGAIYPISLLSLNPLLTIFLQMIFGMAIYVGVAYIFKLECFIYILKINQIKN